MWYVNTTVNSIGRITTTGDVKSAFTSPSIKHPAAITAGPDGALWFTSTGNNSIGRITTVGKVTSYTGTGVDKPGAVAAGPDGALWFTKTGRKSSTCGPQRPCCASRRPTTLKQTDGDRR